MSMKPLSLLIIGVILSGCLGYGVGLMYIPEFVDEIFPNNYRSKLDDLTRQYQNFSDIYDAMVSEIDSLENEVEDLQNSMGELQWQYNDLNESKDRLEEDFNTLLEEHTTLLEEQEVLKKSLNETQESYSNLLIQYQIVTGSAPLSPQSPPNGTIRKDFTWRYGGKTWAISLYIPEHLYDFYSNSTRVPTEDYSVYVTHPYDDEFLSDIIEEFNDIATTEGYDENQIVSLVVAFVQSLPYTTDNVTTGFDEYPRYPIETLTDSGGDCEDTSILTSALLDGMGYDVVLVNLPNHFGVGVSLDAYGTYWLHDEVKYFYVETTGEGWEVGELPEAHQGQAAIIYPILPVPICTHDWTGSILNHKLTIVAKIQNVGTAEARNIKLFVAYEGKEDEIWNPVESAFINLATGEETTIMLELNEPRHVHARIMVRLIDPWGNIIDESHSTWYDTN